MRDYLALTKPRITLMVVMMAALGYFFAGGRAGALLAWTLLGTALASASTGVLNQYWERDSDALMDRTRKRPLPAGRVNARRALVLGLAAATAGTGVLWLKVNGLAAALAAFTIVSYILMYTPLKKVTPQCTWIGSVSGAIPPLIGWAAAAGSLGLGAWLLFAIQFVWQIPHFLALFWIYREDYARAGFKVMPVVDPDGWITGLQLALHSFSLLLASLLPAILGVSSVNYGIAAFILGAAFMALSLRASLTMETADVRRLFKATLFYLPAVFTLLVAI